MKYWVLIFVFLSACQVKAQDLNQIEQAYQALKICALNEFGSSTDSLYQSAKSLADSRLNEDGSVIADFEKGRLEEMAIGRLYNLLYAHTQDARYKKASNWIHHYLVMSYPRNKKTTAQNVFIYNEKQANQMHLDGLYWAVTFFAEWVSTFDIRNTQAWSDIADQFMLLNTQTYNSVTGLNYCLWTSDVDNDETEGLIPDGVFKGCLPEYKAITMARFFAAAVDVLAIIPKEQPDRASLSLLVEQIAEGLMHWNHPESHLWANQIVYTDSNVSDFDVQASDLIISTYLKALRLGMIKDTVYKTFVNTTAQAAENRGCSDLVKSELAAYKKLVAPKKPVQRAPARRPATPVKR